MLSYEMGILIILVDAQQVDIDIVGDSRNKKPHWSAFLLCIHRIAKELFNIGDFLCSMQIRWHGGYCVPRTLYWYGSSLRQRHTSLPVIDFSISGSSRERGVLPGAHRNNLLNLEKGPAEAALFCNDRQICLFPISIQADKRRILFILFQQNPALCHRMPRMQWASAGYNPLPLSKLLRIKKSSLTPETMIILDFPSLLLAYLLQHSNSIDHGQNHINDHEIRPNHTESLNGLSSVKGKFQIGEKLAPFCIAFLSQSRKSRLPLTASNLYF